jgi:hypothetical protein
MAEFTYVLCFQTCHTATVVIIHSALILSKQVETAMTRLPLVAAEISFRSKYGRRACSDDTFGAGRSKVRELEIRYRPAVLSVRE